MRQRFDVKVLERYEFVDYIVEYLKQVLRLKIENTKIEKHLKFYKGTFSEKGKATSVAIVGY